MERRTPPSASRIRIGRTRRFRDVKRAAAMRRAVAARPAAVISWAPMTDRSSIQDALAAGHGILRLEPCWVPRSFMHPGRRLRLHADDLYAFGAHRGGINERWFSSTTNADNGPGTPADEGLSY